MTRSDVVSALAGNLWVRSVALSSARRWLHHNGGVVRTATGVRLAVRPEDPRAARLLLRRGALDREAVAAWSKLIEDRRPTLAIDVGANYGEVSYSANYREGCVLHQVEANPLIVECLQRTKSMLPATHPSPVIHAGAADAHDGWVDLAFGRDSGLSSIAGNGPRSVRVQAFRLDERIERRAGDRVVFKVDVEGAEFRALSGMEGLLDGSVGICEIVHADQATARYVTDRFRVSLFSRGRTAPVDRDELLTHLNTYRTRGSWAFSKDALLEAL